jgi:hypothetical protein
MTDRAKFEEMLERLIAEDSAGAEELFHEIVVEKSREIYSSILESEEEVDETTDEEVDEASEDDLDEATDEEVDEASEDDLDETTDEEVDESDDEDLDEMFGLDQPEMEARIWTCQTWTWATHQIWAMQKWMTKATTKTLMVQKQQWQI